MTSASYLAVLFFYRDEVERIILRKFSDYKEPPPEPSTIVTSDVETGEPVPLEPPPPPKGGTKFPGPRVSLTRYHAAQMYERAGGLMKGMGVTGQQNPQLSDPADFAKVSTGQQQQAGGQLATMGSGVVDIAIYNCCQC